MLLPSDLEPILGRIPGVQMSVDLEQWSRKGWGSGLRVPGALDAGMCTEAGGNFGNLPVIDAPGGRWQRVFRSPQPFLLDMILLEKAVGPAVGGADSLQRFVAPLNLQLRRHGIDSIGDSASGDGWRYRGRGLIQLTLKDNYRAFAKATGIDAVANPDLLLEPAGAVAAACWYWSANGLNALADSDRLDELTYRINRKRLEGDARKAVTFRAREALRSAWHAW
jgi:hypothetical protein